MQLNWIEESISGRSGGVITLAGGTDGHSSLVGAGMPLNVTFKYIIINALNKEVGIGHLTSNTEFVPDRVEQTLVAGTLNRNSPPGLTITGAAVLQMVPDAESVVEAFNGDPFPASGITGFSGNMSGNEFGANAAMGTFLNMIPIWRPKSGFVTTAGVNVGVSAAGVVARIGVFEKHINGKPGRIIGEFTNAATVDCSSTGNKIMTPSSPIYVPSGLLCILAHCSAGGVSFKAPSVNPSLFLGTAASGVTVNTSLYRDIPYAPFAVDQSAETWLENVSGLSIWMN